jgi:transposase
VKVRDLSDEEGKRLQRIVRRGGGSTIRYRRALIVLASAGGNSVPVIARLVFADEDRVREVIHRFNELGMASLDPRWAGGRPRRISTDDETFIVATAQADPQLAGQPFTRWSIRKLAGYLADNTKRIICLGRERLRQILARRDITFQKTKTWKESTDPQRAAKLARIAEVIDKYPDRVFAYDEFGPLVIRPIGGAAWRRGKHPKRLPANYHKLHGVRQFHACYSVGDDTMWGVVRRCKSEAHTLTALKSIRAKRPDGRRIYIVLDNLSAHKGATIRRWAARHDVELCYTPTYASWANPIEAHFGPVRQFVTAGSDYTDHVELTHRLHAYLRWRNANARHPYVLAAQRRERARVRSERRRLWGQPAPQPA